MIQNTSKTSPFYLGWLLAINRLNAQLGINVFRYEKDRHKRNVKKAITIIVIVCLLVLSLYCGLAAYGYAYLGMGALIPGIALVISSLVNLFFTIFKANGELYGFRDYELVMSLPIPVKTVINSRLFNMYFWNTVITILVMAPMGGVYAFYLKPGILFALFWIAGILLACLIPTILAAFIGAIITAIASKFRYASAVSSVLGIGFVVALMALSMLLSTGDSGFGKLIDYRTGNVNISAISTYIPELSRSLNHLYPPAQLFTQAIAHNDFLSLFFFAGVSIGLYSLFTWILSTKYREINTALTSHVSKSDYKMGRLRQGSALNALYKKTIMRILKSSVCATNLLMGCVMAILVSIAFVAIGPDRVLSGLGVASGLDAVKSAACFLLAGIISMTNTACVSLALEGKSIWLIKSLPIPAKTLYDSYILTNITFTVPTSITTGILFGVALKPGFYGVLLMILVPTTYSLLVAVAGVFIGNRMAYYDWKEESQLVKQSLMSIVGMLSGFVVIGICGAIAVTGLIPMDAEVISSFYVFVFIVVSCMLYKKEIGRPIKE